MACFVTGTGRRWRDQCVYWSRLWCCCMPGGDGRWWRTARRYILVFRHCKQHRTDGVNFGSGYDSRKRFQHVGLCFLVQIVVIVENSHFSCFRVHCQPDCSSEVESHSPWFESMSDVVIRQSAFQFHGWPCLWKSGKISADTAERLESFYRRKVGDCGKFVLVVHNVPVEKVELSTSVL